MFPMFLIPFCSLPFFQIPQLKGTIDHVNSLANILADKEANLVKEINAAFDELVALIEARRKFYLSELESKTAVKQSSLGE